MEHPFISTEQPNVLSNAADRSFFSEEIRENNILVQVPTFTTADLELSIKSIPGINIKSEDPTLKHFMLKIDNLTIPKSWEKESVIPPNVSAKEKSIKVFELFFKNHEMLPDQILPSREGGIIIFYKSSFNRNIVLIVEIYNDLNIDALINDDKQKKIIACEDIKYLNFTSIIDLFIKTSVS